MKTILLAATTMIAACGGTAAMAQQYPASPAQRSVFLDDTLHLTPGERAVMRVQPDGRFVLDRIEVVGQALAEPPLDYSRPVTNGAESGTVTLSLGLRRDLGSYLRIDNGTDRTFNYEGYTVLVPGQPPRRSPACAVPAGGVRWERWPIALVQAVAWAPRAVDAPAACADGTG